MRRLYNFDSRFEDLKGQQTRSMIQYCVCGYPIFVRETMTSGPWERSYFDYGSEDRALQLCPNCGADLTGIELSPHVPKNVRDL
jgi:hypothetical protein